MDNSAYRNAPLPAVLQSVKHDTRKLLAARLEALFHSADNALFELADGAASDVDQNLFFDSMRIVRLQRASIQQKYIDAYSRSWSSVMSGQPPASSTATLALDPDGYAQLASEELEMSVAAAGINSKVTTKFLLPLTHLTKRLETVCGHELPPELNPLGPQSLNQNYIAALESLGVHIKVLIILLKLFERFVAQELAPVYDRANSVLIDAGVLPDLAYRLPETITASEVTAQSATTSLQQDAQRSSPSQRPIPDPGAAYANTHPAGLPAETPSEFSRLQSLLVTARDNGYIADPQASAIQHDDATDNGYANTKQLSSAQCVEVLGAVQSSVCEEPVNLSQPAAAVDFRQLLLVHGTDPAENRRAKLEQRSDDVVDLTKMLFDCVLDDNNLAIPMKALIGRLQIPVLKVAIMDQTFFANPNHPARQLLNELATAGIGWSSASELKRDKTYNKIESIVLRVTSSFNEDLTLFSNLIAELRHFVNKENKKRNQVEQRVKETEAGKAKTREANKTIQTLINQKARGLKLPAITSEFIGNSWSKVLVFLFVTRGTDSEEWNESISTLDDLLWASQPLSSDSDVATREALLPALLTKLESGITLANLPEAQEPLDQLTNTIVDIHAADQDLLDATDTDEDAAELAFESAPQAELREQPELILVDDTDAAEELENLAHPQFIESVIQLKAGQWVELRDTNGALIRCKLATVVQPGNRYIFVNRRGMKVYERSRNALALALEAQELSLLDESEMFDRALESVIGTLQRLHDSRA